MNESEPCITSHIAIHFPCQFRIEIKPLCKRFDFLNVTPCLCENHDISIEKILASISDADEGLRRLKIFRTKYLSNPLIGYLNINSLCGDKFLLLKDIISDFPIDVLCIDEKNTFL